MLIDIHIVHGLMCMIRGEAGSSRSGSWDSSRHISLTCVFAISFVFVFVFLFLFVSGRQVEAPDQVGVTAACRGHTPH